MKPLLTALLLASSLTASAKLGYSKANPLVIGLDNDYPPMEYVDNDGMPKGYDVEFTRELMKRLDIPFTYSPNAWEDISSDVINGKVDLGMMVYSPYRKDIINYSRAVLQLYYQIVYKVADNRNFDTHNLSGYKIAYMKSRPIADTLRSVGAKGFVIRNLSQAFLDLEQGKYDAIICFRYQAKYFIQQHKFTDMTTEDLPLSPREYCYVSHDRELIEAINNEIAQMRLDGVINKTYGDELFVQSGILTTIPLWIWYLFITVVIMALIIVTIMQHRHQKQMKLEMQKVMRSERMKTIFLGNVSHALRTPLNSIIGFSDMLANAGENGIPYDERREMFQHINRNGNKLLYFINELLDLSNIEGNELLKNQTTVDLRTIMIAIAAEIQLSIYDGVKLLLDGDEMKATLDVSLLRKVMLHLLSNAARHTLSGTVKIIWKAKDNGLYVAVEDTGNGLPENIRENIFSLLGDKNAYVQNEDPGLGLSICKAIIDKCNGKMGAISPNNIVPGKGTTVWLWVPIKIS